VEPDRRDFLRMLGFGVLAGAASGCLAADARGETRPPGPNVVFILVDDLGYGDPGCYNPESRTPTPHIDRLAAEGMRFTQAHAPGSWCVPSRYGLLTGRFPCRAALNQRHGIIDEGRLTIGSLLQGQGYRTACVGKWHLGFEGGASKVTADTVLRGGPVDRGFDCFFGLHASLDIPPYYYIRDRRCVAPPSDHTDASSSPGVTPIQGAFWRAGPMAPGFRHDQVLGRLRDEAVNFIREHHRSNPRQPFLLYFAPTAPHTPWLPDAPHQGRSRAGEYGDFVAQVDTVVGDVMQTLDTLGLRENTLLFFASDNGPVWFDRDIERTGHRAGGFLRGMKGDGWEGGHRIPLIARWPGQIGAGTQSDAVVCFTDILATLADLMGVALPPDAGEDSWSLLPILRGSGRRLPAEKATIIDANVILADGWKLIRGSGLGGLHRRFGEVEAPAGKGGGELYRLAEDPGETRNLYAARPEVAARLSALLERLKRDARSTPL
jgi:arylsulfatase A